MALLDDAKQWLDREGVSMDDLKRMADENTAQAKAKLEDFARQHNIDINPEDDAKAIWEKIKARM